MKEAFYCNYPCQVLAELPNEKVVIELVTHTEEHGGDISEPPYTDPYFSTIIVDKKYISDKKIDLEEEFKEKERALDEKRRLQEQELYNASWKADAELKRITKELNERVRKYKGLEEYLNYLDGVYKYVVYTNDYRCYGIYDLNKIMCDCDKYDLTSVQFRTQRAKERNEWEDSIMYVGQYSDGSGSKNPVKGFATIEDALVYIKERLDKAEESKVHYFDGVCKEHNISHPKLDKYREEVRKKQEIESQKEVIELQKKLEAAKSRVGVSPSPQKKEG